MTLVNGQIREVPRNARVASISRYPNQRSHGLDCHALALTRLHLGFCLGLWSMTPFLSLCLSVMLLWLCGTDVTVAWYSPLHISSYFCRFTVFLLIECKPPFSLSTLNIMISRKHYVFTLAHFHAHKYSYCTPILRPPSAFVSLQYDTAHHFGTQPGFIQDFRYGRNKLFMRPYAN